MMLVSENEHTHKTIKAGLETLYIAAGYLNADRGNMEITMHLIDAAIAELESIVEQGPHPHIRMVYNAAKSDTAN